VPTETSGDLDDGVSRAINGIRDALGDSAMSPDPWRSSLGAVTAEIAWVTISSSSEVDCPLLFERVVGLSEASCRDRQNCGNCSFHSSAADVSGTTPPTQDSARITRMLCPVSCVSSLL
jgi:hypothetical protein